MGDEMNLTEGQGWNLVPMPKIILAEEIFGTYYRARRRRKCIRGPVAALASGGSGIDNSGRS